MNKLSNKKMVLLLVAMSGTAFAWTPHDSTNAWNVASGNASVAANFNPASAPGANTLVRISNGGEMAVDSDLSWGALWVGRDGTGTVHQRSGELTLNNSGDYSNDGTLWLGYGSSDFGCYHLSGGLLKVLSGSAQIGREGRGLLDVSGGEFQSLAPYYPSIGRMPGGWGFVDVHGQGVFNSSTAGQTTVGEEGAGVLTVRNGGTVQTGKMVLGSAIGTKGIVNVSSGGTLSAKSVVAGSGSVKRINVSGGVIKPNMADGVVSNYMAGVQMTVGAGGLVFDTNGKAVTLKSSVSSSRLVLGNLAHRWSFNGDTTDSVGSMNAGLVGSATSGITYDSGEICLPGSGMQAAAVSLGGGCIPAGMDGITIEIWTTPKEHRDWSRMFTAGGDNSQIYLAWAMGSDTMHDCFYLKTAGTVQKNNSSTFAPWVYGTKYHVTLVFSKQSETSWSADICKRDALTGKPLVRYTQTISGTWDPSDLAKGGFFLGLANAYDMDACASYDEVRIWNVALDEGDLIESSTRGPDADFSSAPCLRKTGDGTLALSSCAAYDGETRVESGELALCAPETPVHRWSFENGSLADSVTARNAEKDGSSSSGIVATSDGKGLELPGAAQGEAHINLGTGTIPSSDRGFTLEIWATLLSLRNWERIFTIYADINNLSFMTWVAGAGTDNTQDYVGFKYNGSQTARANMLAPYVLDQPYHVTAVFLPKDGGGWAVRFYKQNATTGALEKSYEMAIPDGWTPARFASADIKLGFSPDPGNDEANARYDEVRVWDRAFSEEEVVESGRLGPDALPRFAYADGAAGALPATTTLRVDAGATFLLGGALQTVSNLVCNGALEGPGTLTVTETIRPGGASAVGALAVKDGAKLVGTVELDLLANGTCDRIDFAPGGTYDISGIHWTVSNVAATASCNSFIVANASGATLTGEIDASCLPANHVIKQTRDGNLVFKRIKGTMLIVQ